MQVMLGRATDTVVCPNDLTVSGVFSASNYDLLVESTQLIVQTANTDYYTGGTHLDTSLYSKFIISGVGTSSIHEIENGSTIGQIVTFVKPGCSVADRTRTYNESSAVSVTKNTVNLIKSNWGPNTFRTSENPLVTSFIYCGSTIGWFEILY